MSQPFLEWVDTELLRPNDYNPNVMDPEMYEKAIESIHAFGFVDPITAREDGIYREIIDGEHRWKAGRDHGSCVAAIDPDEGEDPWERHLGLAQLPVINLGVVEDSVAKQLTIVLNETRGQPDPKRLGYLLKDLLAKETKDRLLATLPYSREAFDGLVGLPTIQWDQISTRPLTPLASARPSSWVERTYRMPKESAEILDQAVRQWRETEEGGNAPLTPEWRILELIASEWMR